MLQSAPKPQAGLLATALSSSHYFSCATSVTRRSPSACRCSRVGCKDYVAVKIYSHTGGSVPTMEIARHEIQTYDSLRKDPPGPVEGIAHMVDSCLNEAAGMACMVQE